MKIRIGSRKSPLAMWQAQKVQQQLNNLGIDNEIVGVSSEGDENLIQPLYEMGITGVFTRSLDIALINRKIDIAVHSLKDVPTKLPKGLELGGFLKRGNKQDVLVQKKELGEKAFTIATGSLRRKSFIAHHYSQAKFVDLRGNIQTRLQKLKESNWSGAIFALAGLERSEMIEEIYAMGFQVNELDFMLPAASQGIVACAFRQKDESIAAILEQITHVPTQVQAKFERSFLQTLEGGCTLPIGILSEITNDRYYAHGAVLSLDGKEIVAHKDDYDLETDCIKNGKAFAQKILQEGGDAIVEKVRQEMKTHA